MAELLASVMGFLSAGLVVLVALAFGLLFLFFSGSAALVLGRFLIFVRPARVALPLLLAGVAVMSGVGLWLELEPPWLLPVGQALWGAVAYGLLLWRRSHRPLRWAMASICILSGGLFLVSLGIPALEPAASLALRLAAQCVIWLLIGTWPLVLGGLLEHRRQRPVEWFISMRYLVARRRQTFISVITVICVMGVALGVGVITVVLSVMNGFSQVWEGKIIGARAHFDVHSRLGPYADYEPIRRELLRAEGVEGATPYLQTDAILRGGAGEIQAILLKGIDVASVGQATQLIQDLVEGSLEALAADPAGDELARLPGVILGAEIANRFFLRLGDPLVLISPLGGPVTPLGPAPRMVRFRVAGVFRSNFFQFDESFVYTSLAAAQHFMKLDDVVSGIEVRTTDPYRSRAIAERALAPLGPLFYAQDWKTFYPGFFSALKTERVMMFVLLSFIMVVAGFIIIATLIMMIMEKSGDIAILKAMGCTDEGILRIFATQGFLIGVAGVGLGLAMGLIITWNLPRIQAVVERTVGFDVLPANIYQLEHLPYHIVPAELGLIAAIAMVLSVGATLLPCWQAARLDPAEALRYE